MAIILSGGFLAELLVLLATVVAAVVLYMKHKFGYWKRMGVPYLEPSLPFGNMSDLFRQRRSFGGALVDIYKRFKAQDVRFGGIYFLTRPIFVPTDPEIIKSIMQTDFHHFVDRGMYVNEKGDPISAHLFSLNGKTLIIN